MSVQLANSIFAPCVFLGIALFGYAAMRVYERWYWRDEFRAAKQAKAAERRMRDEAGHSGLAPR